MAIPPDGIHLAWITLFGRHGYSTPFTRKSSTWATASISGPRSTGRARPVLFSILARLSVHTYQGTEHPAAHRGPGAILFGVWYRYHRNLWQLIFAHLMIDLLSFSQLKLYLPAALKNILCAMGRGRLIM